MKPCDDLNVDLLRYLDNDLSEQEFKYLRDHLDTCVYCQDRLERERALSSCMSHVPYTQRLQSCVSKSRRL